MTIKEALTTLVGIPIESNAIDLALLNNALDGATAYTRADEKSVDNALINVLFGVIMLQSQSEGDASLSYNYEGIKQRLLYLAGKYGRTDVTDYLQPTVTSKSVW